MNNLKTIHIKYFALLREQSGCLNETMNTKAVTLKELYRELCLKYAFSLDSTLVRASVNARYQSLDSNLNDGDNVVFIPPVAGG